MRIKSLILNQYGTLVNQAAEKLQGVVVPPEGWIVTTRKALGMSAAQLGRRLGKSRALISHAEKAEKEGGVTLKTMQSMADAMGCRFIYAIIPHSTVETVLDAHARKKAKYLVDRVSSHMALEEQTLSQEQRTYEINRLADEMRKNQLREFWDEDR